MLALVAISVVALCNIGLGLVVLLQNRGNFTNTSFAIFAFIMAAWLIATYFSNDTTLSYNILIWLNRATAFLPAMGLYFLLLFSMEYTRIGYKYFRPFAIIFGLTTLGISILAATPYMIDTIYPKGDVVAATFGFFTPIFSFFIIAELVATIVLFIIANQRLSGAARARTQIMALSISIALILAIVTNLIMPVAFGNYNYIPVGLLSSFIIVGGFTYAIIKHRLFDIRFVVARSITYVLLVGTLASAYGFIVVYLGNSIFHHASVSVPQQTFNIVVALILAFTFQPLQKFFAKMTDRIFYRNLYDPENLLNNISHVLASEIGLVELSRKVRSILINNLKVDNVDIVVLNNGEVFIESGHYVVSRLQELAHDFSQLRGHVIVADEEPEGGHRKAILLQYGVNVLAIMRTKKDKRTGYLLFGPKLSGDIFTNTDLKVISTVVDQLAIAIENAKSYVEIQSFNQTLRSKVTVATQKLREANQNLKQIDNLKDDFLSMASHQLQTPLTVVEGYMSNILSGVYGDLNHKQRDAVELTQSRVRLTKGLVMDLLNISRMEAGRFTIDPQTCDINKAIEDEIEHLAMVAKEHEVKISYKKPTYAIPEVTLDEQKIRQVIMNLVNNAITYSPGGQISVSLEVTDKQLELIVKDNGIGVPKAEQAKLFTKFFRADNAKRTRPDGTGIGLFLVKEVVEAHDGHIIFMSDGKKGSTFGFSIPVHTRSRMAADRPLKEPAAIAN